MLRGTRVVFLLALVALIVRISYLFLFVDLSRDYYWEYGELARNLHMGKGYSLFYPAGDLYVLRASPSASPYPSAYMMPGYVAFIFPFFFLSDVVVRNTLLLLVQGVIGAAAVVLMFRFAERFVGRREASVAALVMACLPEFVYASGSYTPTVLFQCIFLLLLPVLYGLWEEHSRRSEYAAGALFAGLVYIRPELVLFGAGCLLLLMVGRRGVIALRVGVVLVLLVLPWQIRNAVVFHEWIPLTTNSGLNFFRGHNDLELGSFADDAIIQGLRDLPPGRDFEPALSRLYFKRAFAYIGTEPAQEFARTASKLEQLWYRDPSDPRSANLVYIVPWLVLLASAAAGLARSTVRRQHRVLILYLGCTTAVAIVFFVLPRYQTMMKVALVPFAAVGLLAGWDMLRRRFGRGPAEDRSN